ncbi:ABC transporter permease [Streptomyces griseoruber]|uniref:ABC transporter permease n=1 Tax=Streptomyces griseoruber TaxID=1943 RepID=UPI00378AE647
MNAHVITTEPAASRTTDDRAGGLTSLWDTTRSFRPALAVLCALLVVLSLANAEFRTVDNLENVAVSVSILWMIALGATFVQLSGGIDLSSGAIAALAGICLAKLLATTVPGPLVIVLVILFGAAVGALANGILVGVLGLNVFVVTLASMTALTGIVSLWSDTQSVYVTSQAVTRLSSGRLLGAPVPVWLMLLTLTVFLFLQTRTYFGRDLYAVGGSPVAARLSGIRAPRTLVLVYALAGAMAALGGIIAVGRVGAAAPQPDNSLPLSAIAAVLLGGTALAGGAGGVGGTALGVLLIGVLQNGLSLSGVPTFWQQVVTGAVLVLAVLGDRGYAPRGLVARLRRHRPRVGSPA